MLFLEVVARMCSVMKVFLKTLPEACNFDTGVFFCILQIFKNTYSYRKSLVNPAVFYSDASHARLLFMNW